MFPILVIIPAVHLLRVIWVLPFLEVSRLMLDLVLLFVLSDGSLLLFETDLLIGSKLEISVFEGSLVWPEPAISWWKLGFHLTW